MATENLQISLGTDDCKETSDTTIELTATTITIGNTGSIRDAGLRWQSVDIPQAATITSAILRLYVAFDSGTLPTNIRGIDEDNTVTWAADDRPSQRVKTTATITANESDWTDWSADSWAYIDITSVIKEIVDRGGWSANNALAVVIENTSGSPGNYSSFRAYEYAGNLHGAKLDIVYESRTAKPSRSTMNVHAGVMFQTLTGGHGY